MTYIPVTSLMGGGIPPTEKGAPGGVATLDGQAKIPFEQMQMAQETIDRFAEIETALDGKATTAALTSGLAGKQATGSYSLVGHGHVIGDVTGLQGALDAKQAAGSYVLAANFTWANLTGKPATFAPTAHTHVMADVTDLAPALAGKQAAGAYLTGNQTVTLSGDLTGSGATTIAATLATVNANVGSFGSSALIPVVTVDGKGRVTAISTVAASGGGGPVRTVYRLASAHSNSTVTPTTITGWTHTLVANKTYRVTILATYQAVALTTGGRMNLLGAGGLAGVVNGSMAAGIAQAAGATELKVPIYSFANGAGSFLLTTAVAPINSPHGWEADFVFRCTTGGTLSLQWASEVATSAAQLNIGSVMIVEEIE